MMSMVCIVVRDGMSGLFPTIQEGSHLDRHAKAMTAVMVTKGVKQGKRGMNVTSSFWRTCRVSVVLNPKRFGDGALAPGKKTGVIDIVVGSIREEIVNRGHYSTTARSVNMGRGRLMVPENRVVLRRMMCRDTAYHPRHSSHLGVLSGSNRTQH